MEEDKKKVEQLFQALNEQYEEFVKKYPAENKYLWIINGAGKLVQFYDDYSCDNSYYNDD